MTAFVMPDRVEVDPDAAGAGEEDRLFGEDFWAARPILKHVRDAAHSRQRSAPAVLAVVLARAAALVDHRLRLPAVVGSDAGLAVISVVLAPPGTGKSTAAGIGAQLLPAPDGLDIADHLPIGSGEGIAEAYFGTVEEPDEKGRTKRVKQQVRNHAFFVIDEGQVLGELASRRGSTLLPTIRSAFSGATLGQQNATEERRRILPPGSYSIGIVINVQTVLADALLADAEGGTPQRLLWLPAIDPSIPANGPDWPGTLPWTPPDRGAVSRLANGWMASGTAHLTVAEPIRREIRARDLARARGQETVALLDAHQDLVRLKVAALLAILDGRVTVGEEDWQLAGVIKQASDTTRAEVEATVKQAAARKESEASTRLARRAAHCDAVVIDRRIGDAAHKIAQKVWAEPGRWTRTEMYRAMRSYRNVFDDALDRALSEGWVTEHIEPGQGDDKRLLRPGKSRPR